LANFLKGGKMYVSNRSQILQENTGKKWSKLEKRLKFSLLPQIILIPGRPCMKLIISEFIVSQSIPELSHMCWMVFATSINPEQHEDHHRVFAVTFVCEEFAC